jgi:5-oxoprolinase (ATP-hydrolysing) subunit A
MEIDLNADLGESPEALANGADFEMMRYITSANVACGGHAGDENTMRQTVAAAKELGVAVGAHPSYPDRENFGRLESPWLPAELEKSVREQMAALRNVANRLGVRLVHVKPHGALYHATIKDRNIALAVGRAVQAIDPQLIMVGQAGSRSLETWREMGLRIAAEAFADRTYERDGTLRKRTLPGALVETPESAAQQALRIALDHKVIAGDGSPLPLVAQTICMHSDTPGAAAIARTVNQHLQAAGVQVRALQLSSLE